MADEQPINIPIEVTGFEQASSELTQLAKRITDLEKATGSAKPKITDAGKAMDQKAVNAAKLSTVMGSLSPIVGRVSTETAKLTQVFSTAGSTVTGLTSVVGGPFGLALGAAVAATGLLVTAMGEAEAAAEAEAEAIRKSVISLEDYIDAARRRREAQALQQRLEAGGGSAAEQEGALEQQRAKVAALARAYDEARNRVAALANVSRAAGVAARESAQAEAAAALARLQAAEAVLPAMEAQLQLAETLESTAATSDRNSETRSERAHQRHLTSAADMERDLENLIKITDARVAASEAEERRIQKIQAAGAFNDRIGRSQADLQNEAAIGSVTGSSSTRSANDNGASGGDDFFSRIARESAAFSSEDADVQAQAHEDAAKRIKGAYMDAFGVVADAGVNAFAAIVTGQDVAVGALLAGVGQQLAAQGLKHVFEGGARSIASFGVDPSGPALMGIGAAEIAAGAAMGAVGNSVSAPSSGGGSSSGPPKPADQMQSSNDGGGMNVTIIQNNVVPDAYAGERIRDALRRDEYRRGRVAA